MSYLLKLILLFFLGPALAYGRSADVSHEIETLIEQIKIEIPVKHFTPEVRHTSLSSIINSSTPANHPIISSLSPTSYSLLWRSRKQGGVEIDPLSELTLEKMLRHPAEFLLSIKKLHLAGDPRDATKILFFLFEVATMPRLMDPQSHKLSSMMPLNKLTEISGEITDILLQRMGQIISKQFYKQAQHGRPPLAQKNYNFTMAALHKASRYSVLFSPLISLPLGPDRYVLNFTSVRSSKIDSWKVQSVGDLKTPTANDLFTKWNQMKRLDSKYTSGQTAESRPILCKNIFRSFTL